MLKRSCQKEAAGKMSCQCEKLLAGINSININPKVIKWKTATVGRNSETSMKNLARFLGAGRCSLGTSFLLRWRSRRLATDVTQTAQRREQPRRCWRDRSRPRPREERWISWLVCATVPTLPSHEPTQRAARFEKSRDVVDAVCACLGLAGSHSSCNAMLLEID